MYFIFFGILAGWVWQCSGKGERLGYERCGFGVQVGPWFAIFFLIDRKAFNNRSQISKG